MNNYHIYQEQAKGKYSVIFKARKKKRLQFVAIKRLQKTRKSKVFNEAKILTQLNNHPNIIKFFDFMQTKNHMWQITQYCPGGDLLKIIEYDKQLPQNTVRSFMLQILAGVQYTHSKGIVLCDIKPASILVNQYGNVKLGDFGSAQKLVDLMGKSGKKKGTPSYMAPQLFQVNGVYSFQSDLWALGCMMYELGQGNPPFVSTNFQQISQLARTAQTPKIDSFSSDFNNLLCRILQKDPQNRISWKQLINHPWIKKQLPQIQIPLQNHFLQYLKSRTNNKNQQLRVSHNFQNQNYGKQSVKANDRRQLFEFQNYNEEQFQQNQYLEEQQQMQGYMNNIQVNMNKNKEKVFQNYKMEKNNLKNNKNSKQKNQNQPENLQFRSPNKNSRIQDSANINLFLETLTSKPTIPLQQAINHQSDTAVKPIIGNKDIELIQSINFNKKQLGFTYIEPQILAQGIVNNQMDQQLKKILDGMKGEDKVNVLGYFQTIVQNSQVANYLFKSNFIPYYMSLLKSYKQSNFRSKICEILGFLIRHATSIDSDILKYGIISGFVEAVTKDKSQKVRRKAMAALGQLLFYGATQVDQQAMEWDIPLSLISTLLKILKNTNQDQVVRIYCCKSIQNITAQAQKVGLNFSQIDTLMVMISCFNTTKNQGFKTSIMSCIHHMITLNSTLRQIFLQKMPQQIIINSFQDSQISSRTLQTFLWIFLQQLYKTPKSKQSKQLFQNKNLIKAIFSVMQNGSSVVKGRVYLFIYFLLNYDFKKISLVSQSKLFHQIQRHGKQTGKYQSQALQFVVAILYENFGKILKYCIQQVQSVIVNPGRSSQKNSYIIIILQMQSCAMFQQVFCNPQYIQQLLNILNIIQVKKSPQSPYLQHFKNNYFMILQKIFLNQSTTQKLQQIYCNTVLPFLIGKLFKTSHNDIRYSCIKYIIYLINFCLSQEFLYDSSILVSTSSKITSLILTYLIPQLDVLIDQGEIVANMMFKLMAEIFKDRRVFVQKFWQSCNVQKLLQFYTQNSTINVLKTVQNIFSYKKNPYEQKNLSNIQQFLKKTIQLLKLYKDSNQQLFIEYPLSILKNIITNYDSIKIDKTQIGSIFEVVVILQSYEDNLVRIKAEQLMARLLEQKMFSEKGLQDWKHLSKKGMDNYELFYKLSGLKPNIKPSQGRQIRAQKQSRYN